MKSLFHSKTFWLACIQALAGMIAIFATTYPNVGILLLAKSVIDVSLRFATTTEVTL